jgi:CRP/FNR family transcriptional regulator
MPKNPDEARLLAETVTLSGVFSSLTPEERAELLGQLRLVAVEPPQPFFEEGDTAEDYYILAEGKAKIVKPAESGQDVILELIFPGDVFGALAVFEGRGFPASALPIGKSSAVALPRGDLQRWLTRRPSIMTETVTRVTARVRNAHEMRRRLATERVERRILHTLLDLATKIGETSPQGLVLRLTRKDVAEMVGTTVETSIRVLSRLTQDGLLLSERGRIIIPDLKRLEEEGDVWG